MSPFIQRFVKGFTLIELLVVISIIGLLASTVLAALDQSRIKARIASTQIELAQIHNAMELFRLKYNEYAPRGSDFCNICTYWGPGNPAWDAIPAGGDGKYDSHPYASGNWATDIIGALDTAGFLKNSGAVTKDAWGNDFLYDRNQGFSCDTWSPICSRGPNGTLETPHCQSATEKPKAGGDDICIFLDP